MSDLPAGLSPVPEGYADWLTELKGRIHTAQQRATLAVNRELVLLYWQIGRDILAQQAEQGWGAKVIERLSQDLRTAFPDMKGFSRANLMYMRAFAEAWPDAQIVQQAVGQLPWGHNLALQQARLAGDYDYYWVLMNDLVFDEGVDPVRALVETMEREERMAILSPTNAEGGYPGASRRPEGGWRKVTTADYLGLMMKARAVDEVGFLRPEFRYCWGAIHDLSYRMYRAGWFLAYSDDLAYDLGLIDTNLPRYQYRAAYRINELASEHAESVDFSKAIRAGQRN